MIWKIEVNIFHILYSIFNCFIINKLASKFIINYKYQNNNLHIIIIIMSDSEFY